MKERVAFVTFGCKTNYADSVRVMNALPLERWRVVDADDAPDVVIFNSCTVTAKGDRDLFRAVRRALRQRPDVRVLITGCTAEAYPETIRERFPGISVFGIQDRAELMAALGASVAAPDWPDEGTLATGPRTRMFLKIQEGCDYSCSYCVVPAARGASRSLAPERVEALVRRAVELGAGEVVLSGIHLGFYGRDLEPGCSLPALLDRLARLPRLPRVRLSSIEPNEVDGELLGAMSRHAFVARYLHIPLQSGDDGVLARMRRRHDAARFDRAVAAVSEALGVAGAPVGLGSDVLVGFPGEDDDAHRNTVARLRAAPVTYLHVFSFSPRPGTPAADMPGRVDGRVIKARVAELRALSEEKRAAFARAHVGRGARVLIEEEASPGSWVGYTDTYLRASFPAPPHSAGAMARVRVEAAEEGRLSGRVVREELP
jgi:threonylcarbamoyladenosine tRNA methylthiotransferase MtaB